MLFDLRSRGRRRAVKIIYGSLALVMVAGLVLVGVGTGNSGGLLNAFTNNGGGSSSNNGTNAIDNQQIRAAIKATKKDPKSPSAWAGLMQARWTTADNAPYYNSTTGVFNTAGKAQLRAAATAWQRYLNLTNDKPSIVNAQLAAGIYQGLSQWAQETNAWNYAAQDVAGSKQAGSPLLCLALSAYAAGQTTKGSLAATQALKLTPKLQRLSLQSSLKSAKSSPSTAQGLLTQYAC